jgi:hypothetical protein
LPNKFQDPTIGLEEEKKCMATAESDFQKWFVESLNPLRTKGNAGFIFVFVAFPLLERYLRRKSGCPDGQPLTDGFFKQLRVLFDGIAGQEREFWHCYRNGLLHEVTFPQARLDKKTGTWDTLPDAGISGSDPRPVYFLPKTRQFFLNPISFFDAVTNAILADFTTYEDSTTTHFKLPWEYDPLGAVSGSVPTINVRLQIPDL